MNCSLDSKLFFTSICSIRIRSRKWDIFEKPLQHSSNPYVNGKPISNEFFSDRRAFAKLFASTGSDVGLTQSASESIIVKARGWINQVATGLKGAKSVTHRNGVAAWGVPLLTFVFFSFSKV